MKKIFITGLVFATVVLGGCASAGNHSIKNESQESVQSKLVKGKTTKDEVRQLFGAPGMTTFNAEQSEQWIYTLANTQVKGTSFIPFYGLFDGGADTQTKQLIVIFKNGVVDTYSLSDSVMETKTGLLN
ncbi:TPA: outer membrane protein assembly factor BamE domain-containing protein [Morganella morganii]|uniref:outer membrane protein assembly factor BamE domain-containing protein n=2 Tax=Morganella morganii TaxID=582 RepID=UPI001F443507|nr:outer membrane protein assembly factor BamE [Morganella morganii]